MKDTIWRCHDGRRMLVSEMTTEHIANCIMMINRGHDKMGRRVGPKTKALLPRLILEVQMRAWGLR